MKILKYWTVIFRIPVMAILLPLVCIGYFAEYLIDEYVDVYLPGTK
jgi:hypothetical protein